MVSKRIFETKPVWVGLSLFCSGWFEEDIVRRRVCGLVYFRGGRVL